MKCHRVLGIEESANVLVINQAYQKKLDYLNSNGSDYSETFREKKAEELLWAKNACIRWFDSSESKKLSLRIQETKNRLANPNIMYSSEIGCCSGCAIACSKDKCCSLCCGDDCVSCATAVDIGSYVMLGLLVIGGLFSLKKKIKAKKQEEDERYRIFRQNEAFSQDMILQEKLKQAHNQLNAANDNLIEVTREYDRVVAFCKFIKAIGGADCVDIIAVQEETVADARAQINNVQDTISRIQAEKQKNDAEIIRWQ